MPSFETKLHTFEAVKTFFFIVGVTVTLIGAMWLLGDRNVWPLIENFLNNMQNRSNNV